VTNADAQAWLADTTKTTYFFDTRSELEFTEGHVAGVRLAPGGQLVQATDEHLAVRNARIALTCDNGRRSATTVIWLAGMGHYVWILNIDTAMDEASIPTKQPHKFVNEITADTLKKRADPGTRTIDVSKGLDYRTGHIEGAAWGTRAHLTKAIVGDPAELVVVGQSAALISGVNFQPDC